MIALTNFFLQFVAHHQAQMKCVLGNQWLTNMEMHEELTLKIQEYFESNQIIKRNKLLPKQTILNTYGNY